MPVVRNISYFILFNLTGYLISFYLTTTSPVLVHPCDTKTKGGCSHKCKKSEEEEEEEDGEGYTCTCPPGFKLLPNNITCKKVHPCDRKNNGGCTGVCNKDGEKAKCSCNDGFELLADKMTCVPG